MMKHLYEKLEEILGDDLPKFLSDSRNMDLVVKIYSFGFKQGAEVAKNAANDTIKEYYSNKRRLMMKEENTNEHN